MFVLSLPVLDTQPRVCLVLERMTYTHVTTDITKGDLHMQNPYLIMLIEQQKTPNALRCLKMRKLKQEEFDEADLIKDALHQYRLLKMIRSN